MADNSSTAGPKSSFEAYRAEGDMLFKQQEFKKALESYNQALELRSDDKNCLVARSRCYLQMGDTTSALTDAEMSMHDEPSFFKGLLCKADALYFQGEFEMALVFYHRGNRLRPEQHEFRLGIQKCQEAIDNSVGSPDKVKLKKDGDLSYFYKPQKEEAEQKKKQQHMRTGRRMTTATKKPKTPINGQKDKTIKQLLGSLYADREYLEQLLKEEDAKEIKTKTSQAIHNLALHGLLYLDTRTDFWRQQKPMYARKRDKELQQSKLSKKDSGDPGKFTLAKLREIDDYHTKGKYKEVIKISNKTMQLVNSWAEGDLSNRQEVKASLHSSAGNAYLELGDFEKALEEHKQDLAIAKSLENVELESRAMDNLGRVYARFGKFEEAIDVWEKKVEKKSDMQDLEAAWIYHELGRCYLEIDNVNQAKEYGEKSYSHAQSADDEVWQLHSSVLIAQSQAKDGELEAAVDAFERALDYAKLQEDSDAETAIKKALKDVNDKIARKANGTDDAEDSKGVQSGEEGGEEAEEEFEEDDELEAIVEESEAEGKRKRVKSKKTGDK